MLLKGCFQRLVVDRGNVNGMSVTSGLRTTCGARSFSAGTRPRHSASGAGGARGRQTGGRRPTFHHSPSHNFRIFYGKGPSRPSTVKEIAATLRHVVRLYLLPGGEENRRSHTEGLESVSNGRSKLKRCAGTCRVCAPFPGGCWGFGVTGSSRPRREGRAQHSLPRTLSSRRLSSSRFRSNQNRPGPGSPLLPGSGGPCDRALALHWPGLHAAWPSAGEQTGQREPGDERQEHPAVSREGSV